MGELHRMFMLTGAVLVLVRPVPSGAHTLPTTCADSLVMQADLSRFTPPKYRVFLTVPPGGKGTPDPLVSHITDFFRSAIAHDIDPRLAPAIAGDETTEGTAETPCDRNDNPWNLEPCSCSSSDPTCNAFGDLSTSVEAISTDLDFKIHRDGCTSIDRLQNGPCTYCTDGCANWVSTVKCYFGACPINLGGDPDTQNLRYPTDGSCLHADCNGDGTVTVSEIITAVNIALGNTDASACPAAVTVADCGSFPGGLARSSAVLAGCYIVSVADIQQAVFDALNGPDAGDPTPLPTLAPDQMEADPCEACGGTCTSCTATGHCGTENCTFCESGACPTPCAGCLNDQGSLDCSLCPCGDSSCGFCGSCPTATPTLPPTNTPPATDTPTPVPTPTATAACSLYLDPVNSWDCTFTDATAVIAPPFAANVTQVTMTQSSYGPIDLAPNGAPGRFAGAFYFIGGAAGTFSAVLTAYDSGGPICSQSLPLYSFGPNSGRVYDPDLGRDVRLCGLGTGAPGLLPTSSFPSYSLPSCHFYVNPQECYDIVDPQIWTALIDPPWNQVATRVTAKFSNPTIVVDQDDSVTLQEVNMGYFTTPYRACDYDGTIPDTVHFEVYDDNISTTEFICEGDVKVFNYQ